MKTLEEIIASLSKRRQRKIRKRALALIQKQAFEEAAQKLKGHPGILGTLTGDEIRKITAEPFGPAKQIGKHADER